MKKYINPNQKDWKTLVKRPAISNAKLLPLVASIFKDVADNGDSAIRKYTEKFDGATLNSFEISDSELTTEISKVDIKLKNAILQAADNIETFHKTQLTAPNKVETMPGVKCWQETRAIDKVGIYIPGGSAPLFSTVLMLGIPAKIAGCKEIILCTPPNQNGEINPAILYAAKLVGIRKIFKIGGVQAIAAMTYGTASVPNVFKIFGPGNQYVTAAKQYALQSGIAIDMPAGPSELLVMADETANLAFVASDLLSQAEHGADSQVVTVLNNAELIPELEKEIAVQLQVLPRAEMTAKALQNSSIIVLPDANDRIAFVNTYAPEHLIISERKPTDVLSKIENAGSVFLGNYTPESAGDYASGTNHTLPTNGYAAMYSGVNMDAFLKKITVQSITKLGLVNIGETIEIMAEAEELLAHKNAVSIRLKTI